MKVTGRINGNLCFDAFGKPLLTLAVNEKSAVLAEIEKLMKRDRLSIELKPYRAKRSIDANRYFWHLCGEIAEKRSNKWEHYTKDDIYRKAIMEDGVFRDDEVDPEDVEWRCKAWEMIGEGWLTQRIDFSQDGNRVLIRFYYGSSQYNTKQMSLLIQNVIQDCIELDIPTMTPNEVANMLSLWGTEGNG